MIMALFGPSESGSREPRSLVEFRAGKMKLEESTNMVVPDKRKGLVFMKLDNYGLLHFYWKDRQHGRLEDVWVMSNNPTTYILNLLGFYHLP